MIQESLATVTLGNGSLIVRALPLWQPFAQLVADGWKPLETRSAATNVRGEFLVCATKKLAPSRIYDRVIRQLDARGIDATAYLPDRVARGKALALANLVTCRPMLDADEEKAWIEACDTEGKRRFVYELAPVRKFTRPFDVRCGQRWFNVHIACARLAEALA